MEMRICEEHGPSVMVVYVSVGDCPVCETLEEAENLRCELQQLIEDLEDKLTKEED